MIEEYAAALLFFVIACLLGVAMYALLCFPVFPKEKTRRKRINVRYLCTTHLQEGRQKKEFVILKDTECELCRKERKA